MEEKVIAAVKKALNQNEALKLSLAERGMDFDFYMSREIERQLSIARFESEHGVCRIKE